MVGLSGGCWFWRQVAVAMRKKHRAIFKFGIFLEFNVKTRNGLDFLEAVHMHSFRLEFGNFFCAHAGIFEGIRRYEKVSVSFVDSIADGWIIVTAMNEVEFFCHAFVYPRKT